MAQYNDSTHYHVSYSTTGIINHTNDANSYVLNNAFAFNVRKKSISLNSTNSWIYGQNNQSLTNNDFSTSLDFNIYRTSKLFYWGLANYDNSFSLKINERYQTGAGVAYSFVDNKTMFLNLSDGILYEKSNLMLNDTTREIYHTPRNSLRVRLRFEIKDIFVIDGTHFLQNSLLHSEDYIIKSVTNLSVKLRKWLSFTTTVNYNLLNRTHRENLLLNFGITAEKYF
ncbi:Protein of unknown function, DUF481 [Filimonas lacunae]|uniref:DUF481 domain-containing protein n=1 Tax=Filimonas lacunae TaxID=477680 RepID=A0A173MLE0_9BACT|nr:DUF481 domain-containing protein [Filimonas lacunae]BAV08434.1 hypothetical protein FLA_4475 [Filimonas lacunae]SIT33921.1 Protein of unknown function, DUF481 [Filimonas lacunae]